MISGSFKNVIYKICLEIIYLIYMYKKELALNHLQWLICHKTKPNQTKPNIYKVLIYKLTTNLSKQLFSITRLTRTNNLI